MGWDSLAEPEKLILEYDSWEKAGKPLLCDWCNQRVELLDTYWLAVFSRDGGPPYCPLRVCAGCAIAGPPLEAVLSPFWTNT